MSDNVPVSALRDLVDRSYTDGDPIFASVEEAKRNDIELRIAQLNDALADLETRYAAAAAARDNRVQGKLQYRTDTYRLSLDPDGLGMDQALSRVESGGVDITAVSIARNVAGTLITFTIPANALRANEKVLKFTCYGTQSLADGFAVLEIRLASATISTIYIQSNARRWIVTLLISRTSCSAQDWFIETRIGAAFPVGGGVKGESAQAQGSMRLDFGTGTLIDTAAIAFDVRNDGTGDTANTITQE